MESLGVKVALMVWLSAALNVTLLSVAVPELTEAEPSVVEVVES